MKSSGFTLLELLVVIAIIGILARIIFLIPRDTFAVRAATDVLTSQVTRARMEALKRNEFVGVHINGTNKTFFVFVDANRDLAYASTETIIPGTQQKLGQGELTQVKLNYAGTSDIIFDTRGISRLASTLSVPFQNVRATYTRTVQITPQGRAQTQ